MCFVAYRDHRSVGPQVFITDMAAGQLYVTSTRTRETEVKSLTVDGTNLLKQAVGVAFDATGGSCSQRAIHSLKSLCRKMRRSYLLD